jgi:molybdopterin-guanine dinucleotide biosynthesis protein A
VRSDEVRLRWTGALLVGGRSRRMGRDKLALPLDGGRLVDRAADALRVTCCEHLSVGRDLGLDGFRFVPDALPGCGPLGGLVAALEACPTPGLVALAGDLPGIDAAFVRALQERASLEPGSVWIPRSEDGLQPLAAAWPAAAAAPLRVALESGVRALRRAVELVPHQVWELPRTAKMRAALRNLNAPPDWEAFTGSPLPSSEPDA